VAIQPDGRAALRVTPAGSDGFGAALARRIAAGLGGSLEREADDAAVLRLPAV